MKTRMKANLEHARELGRELRDSGASGVEVVDTVTDAFSSELVRLPAYREVYKARVGQRIRAAKGT